MDVYTRSCLSADADASIRAVLVATVTGAGTSRDTGASALSRLLNELPGYQVRGFSAGAGWVHLSEFSRRWLVMRDKMTNPRHPEWVHFSQFHAADDDVFAPEAADTDFRPLAELLRRRIKPAWYQLFNTSKVLCGLRKVVLEAHNPNRRRGFGFMHAFDEGAAYSTVAADGEPPSHTRYTVQQSLRSLDLFLALFPRGRLVVHLPAPSSPDAQSSMRRELRRYAHSRPDRAMLTSGGDFRNLTDVAVRLSTLLEEPYVAASASMHGEEGRVSSSRHQRKRHGVRSIGRGGASSTAATDLLRSRIHQFQSALKKGRARRERAAGG